MRNLFQIIFDWLTEKRERRPLVTLFMMLLTIPAVLFAGVLEKWGLSLEEAIAILFFTASFISLPIMMNLPNKTADVEMRELNRTLNNGNSKHNFLEGLVKALQGPHWIRNGIIYLTSWFLSAGGVVAYLRPEGTSWEDYEWFGGAGWVGVLMVVTGVVTWFIFTMIVKPKKQL